MRRALAALCLAAASLAPAAAAAQVPATPQRVTITGRVVDAYTRLAIPGVTVSFEELGLSLVSDADGAFEIVDAPVGVYELRISAPGYRDAVGNFAIMQAGTFVTTLTPLGSDEAAPRGRLVGQVSDAENGRALQGVRVRVEAISLDGLTGEDGRFAYVSVPPGRHVVEFSSLGYATRSDTITVVAGSTSDARVAMSLDPVEVEPITVIVERRDVVLERQGFYERRRVTTGDFIDRETIDAQNPVEMTDVFSRLNGVQIRLADGGNPLTRSVVLTRGRAESFGGVCYPSVYLNGLIVHRGGSGPAMLNQLLAPDQVAGIEVYHGGASVPAEYGGTGASCGVIVIWTGR